MVSVDLSAQDDPLTLAIAPPPDETPEQAAIRLAAEAQALKVNDEIEEELKAERLARKKRNTVKVLLLGQSESGTSWKNIACKPTLICVYIFVVGKSTTLKSESSAYDPAIFPLFLTAVACLLATDFLMTYAPNAWAAERASWRAVVYYNLVRSVNGILDFLAADLAAGVARRTTGSPEPLRRAMSNGNKSASSKPNGISKSISLGTAGGEWTARDYDYESDDSDDTTPELLEFNEKHRLLKLRLTPLRMLQRELEQQIGLGFGNAADEGFDMLYGESSYNAFNDRPATSSSASRRSLSPESRTSQRRPQEFFVRSRTTRKHSSRESIQKKNKNDAGEIISGCADDIQAIWEDPVVQEMLKRRGVMLENSAGL